MVALGRLGDTILLFAGFQEIFRRTGLRPKIIVSNEYASVYDGVTYAEPVVVNLNWWKGVPEARKLAEKMSENVIVPTWWMDKECPIPPEYRGTFALTCHGNNWGVDMFKWPNYMTSMWSRMGFTAHEMMTLPLEFDNRNKAREQALVSRYLRGDKPLLLLNFSGISSPFKFSYQVMSQLKRYFGSFQFLDLGSIRATRIYDLLGLYDIAAGLITIDTSTLHLAQASKIPYVAYTVDGWSSSVPRGNVVKEIKYSDAPKKMNELSAVVEGWRR